MCTQTLIIRMLGFNKQNEKMKLKFSIIKRRKIPQANTKSHRPKVKCTVKAPITSQLTERTNMSLMPCSLFKMRGSRQE